jgi:mono/diheme cytochrome c family protein
VFNARTDFILLSFIAGRIEDCLNTQESKAKVDAETSQMVRPPRPGRVRQCLIAAATLAITPAFGADPDNGERLARRWCAPCHVVASNQRGATSEAPPFATIANRPDFDAAKIAFFLLEPHPKMPNMSLSRTEVADLAAYIATLK